MKRSWGLMHVIMTLMASLFSNIERLEPFLKVEGTESAKLVGLRRAPTWLWRKCN